MSNQGVVQLKAELRNEFGTGSARAARRSGKIPAIAYGEGVDNIAFTVCAADFNKKRRSGSISAHLIELDFCNGDKKYAVMREMQKHVVTGFVQHVDFHFVDKNADIRIDVPVVVINEHKCPGVKRGGIINLLHRTLTIKCQLGHIPDAVEIDVSELTIGRSIHASDLKLPLGVAVAMKEENPTVLSISSFEGAGKEAAESSEGESSKG